MADLTADLFAGYNPVLARHIHRNCVVCRSNEDNYLPWRGHVFVDAKPLQQAFRYADLVHGACPLGKVFRMSAAGVRTGGLCLYQRDPAGTLLYLPCVTV